MTTLPDAELLVSEASASVEYLSCGCVVWCEWGRSVAIARDGRCIRCGDRDVKVVHTKDVKL